MSKTRRNLVPRNGNGNGHSTNNRLEGLFDTTPKNQDVGPELHLKKMVEGRTNNQKSYLKSMKTNDITFCIGPAGTGKTHLAVGMGAYYLSKGTIERIILVRPAVSCDEDLGFLPGE